MSTPPTAFDIYHASDFKRDLTIIEDRLGESPETPDIGEGAVAIRWDHADDPWLEYDGATLNRRPSEKEDSSWQRDRPFWKVLDQAEHLDDEALLAAWDEARFAFHLAKEAFRFERLGLDPVTNAKPVDEYRAEWFAQREAGRQARRVDTRA